MAKSHLPAYSAKIHPSNEPETDPNSYSLEKFKLYETRARFYLIGSDRNKRFFRVLKIDRSEPSDLNISEDPVVYSPQEIKNLLQRISEGNRATGGLTFVAKVFGIAGCIKFLESYYLILVTKRRQIGCICGHAIYSIDESQLITIPHVSIQSDVAHSKTELSYLKRGVNDRGRVANDVETEQVVLDEEAGSCKGKMSSVVQMRGSIPLFWSQEASRFSPKPDIILQRYDPTYQATKMHFEDLAKRYGNPIIVLNLIKTVEKRPREMMLRREFANAVGYLNTILSEENQVRFIHWDFHKFAKSKSANVLAVLGGVASEALDLTGFYYSGKSCITKKRTSQLRDLRASSGDLARVGSCNESLNSVGSRERDADFYQQSKTNSPDGAAPCFQSGVLRTNCIDCLDRTNVAQYAYGLAALGRQLHAMGLTDMPKVNPNSSIAAALMDMYQSMGDALAQQYGGSAAHNTLRRVSYECQVFPERQGKWKATTQSREFLKSIKRYYSNAYTDGEKQDAINLFLGYFQPQEGKPALWELDSDYYLHVSGIGDDLFPEKCLEGSAKAVGIGRKLAPIPACREDFSRMKLTSFDKLIERTCSSIKNVRLCSEPDQRPGGVAGNSGVAPDAAEIQLKSPNWLFGQRKLEGSGAAAKVTTNETANREVRRETRGDSFCDLNWLSSADDINDEDIFQRYSAMTYADEANGWYGGTLLGDQDENSEIYKHYAELCQGPAMEPFEHDHEREKYYADVLRMNTIDVVDDHAVEAEMVAALSEYEQIGANLGIIPTSCKSFAEDPSQLSRWMIGEEKLQRV
ncbi:phosphatidylinositol-3-phosphatase SAC1 [Citrus sinensis]|uniref:Phosphatidylinositol-3-phosphatase SAC1 n=1 Tax=Citrus sinensis TaxID=2711 RepID=A0ACB8KUS3_CITSI|nr:phosphatidylinositol-3-phosphatase SAC1 [Citrus sinensis]